MPIAPPCKWRASWWLICWRWTRAVNPFRCALRLRGQKQSRERENSQQLWRSRLREKIRPVRGCWSFLRHADLSPDGRSQLVNTKGNSPKRIPLVTHRLDESGRVSLAGCSPAEPASVSSTHSGTKVMFDLSAIHRPVLAYFVDCARGLRLPIHPTVCFEVGRFTLTQSSWTASAGVVPANGCLATLPMRWSC